MSKAPKLLAFRGNDVKVKTDKQVRDEALIKRISYNQAKKMLSNRSEGKFLINNTFAAGTASSTTAGIADVCGVPQGDSDSARNGDQIMIRSFQFRYAFIPADSYNICRLIIFQWGQDDSPGASDILGDTTYGVMSPYRKDTRGHYRILYDKTHLVETNKGVVGSKFISRGFKKKILFDAATTVGQNKIFFLHVSDSSAVSHPTLRIETQLNYMDA